MMGEVLSREFGDTALSRCVQPRSPFQSQHYTWFNDSIHNLKQLDHFISQQENEASGMLPLLIFLIIKHIMIPITDKIRAIYRF